VNSPTSSSVRIGKNKTRYWLWSVLSGLVLILVAAYIWWSTRIPPPKFVTAQVTRGSVVRTIVTTGTLNPVVTVQVGSNISGTIQRLYCDYNTKVKAGQLCAKIDPRPYQVVFDQAVANLLEARAQLNKDNASLSYARINYTRDVGLQKKGIVSQDTLDSDKSSLDQGTAQVAIDSALITQRQSALDAAKVNLDYTNIVSPVDGTVISRSIDVGQTVAASFQTPTLFLIAKDLTQMQVDTNVSESDVSSAKTGQKVTFTVEAFPDRVFQGRVIQVRKAPIAVQNVVTYDVVIGVSNPDFALLPGMTANVSIITDEHDNVLRVPVQALRFTLQKIESGEPPALVKTGKETSGHVYVLREGKPLLVTVQTGLNDGKNVEISGKGVQLGDAVIVNEIISDATKSGGSSRSVLRL